MILAAVITCGLFTTAKAQTAYDDQYNNNQSYNDQQNSYNQPQQYYSEPAPVPAPNYQQSFYYYPDANVYFDLSCNRYIYFDGNAWLYANTLPTGIFIGRSPRFLVYHNGPRVWMDNAIHINNYRRTAYREPVAFNERVRFDNRQDFRHFDTHGFNGRGGFREAHYRR